MSSMTRRTFLHGAGVAGASLLVGFGPGGIATALAADRSATELNPFVRINPDGSVTAIIKHFEMGQGTTTGLTTLIAEELDADWATVSAEFAPADNDRYKNLLFGVQGTGGSTAMANSFMQYRQAGAAAREVLVRAAAQTWDVSVTDIQIEFGVISAGDKRGSFGDFIEAAASIPPNDNPTLKSAAAFRYIGNDSLSRKDSAAKTDGSAVFAMDVKVDNMVYAVILRSPVAGGRLQDFDASGATGSPGFIAAQALPNGAGVAVFAESTYAAIRARRQITANWDNSAADVLGSEALLAKHLELNNTPSMEAGSKPLAESDTAVGNAASVLEETFVVPYLAHAPMEPLNCVVEPTENGIRVHDGCQFPGIVVPTFAAILKLSPEQVEINTVYAGGSFGRRATPTADYHVEAALAFALRGGKQAVKLVWTREDDLAGGYYRPMFVHQVRVGLSDRGDITGWSHRLAGQSIFIGTPFEQTAVQNGIEHAAIEGVQDSLYAIPNFGIGLSYFQTPRPALWWRSVGHSQNAYVMEVLVDMLARKAGVDPYEYRMSLLGFDTEGATLPGYTGEANPARARLANVLRVAAEKSGWANRSPDQHMGIAAHYSFSTFVAEVVEVSLHDNKISIDKVTCAVDCGVAVNPDIIRAQMEGGIGFGLGAVMRNKISLNEGVVEQRNFPDYIPLRMADMPNIDVHIVPSEEAPTGVGEPGVPPAGPALANAIFSATGERVTTLPMTDSGIEFV